MKEKIARTGKRGMGILPMVHHGRDARGTSAPMPRMAHRQQGETP